MSQSIQLNRTDTTDTGQANTNRIVLFKSFDAATPALLQLAMNVYILTLPTLFPSYSFDIVQGEFYHYVNAPPIPVDHHVCYLQIYFEGRPVGVTPPSVLGV